ncbi:putative manganese transporter [Metaclostridioides mangenotii]|uniref:putative manganese transporter n=1 Tax=Metaclostridioides mangenotii TaxID=1540 RepID=UPI000463BE4E|nr:putative manganese transporter [Clostridioides mangenotii]
MELIISASEESFLHVGSMIGFFILLFEYINHKTSGKFTSAISNNKKYQPVFGALIGAIPGCGGTLAIVPLYISGNLSFGTIIASLIASLGDAAFVLISANFKLFIFITILTTITGIITGYIVDGFKLGEKLGLGIYNKKRTEEKDIKLNNGHSHSHSHGHSHVHIDDKNHEGSTMDKLSNEHGTVNNFAFVITHGIGYKVYISMLIIGFVFMVVSHSGLNLPFKEAIHTLEELISVLGILLSIVYMWCFKKVFKNENTHEAENKKLSLREMLIHSVGEISFVITWIFVAYFVYDIIILLFGGDQFLVNLVLSTGVVSVFIGAALGLIPGCGIQIVLMSFYLKGNIPLGALVANAISQDGDALFPILAMDKKAAMWSMIITTIPAVFVGVIVYIVFG